MKEKASRLQSAYGELVKRKLASTKKDIAEKMGSTPPNVSSAFNGDPRVLTDRFISRFNSAYDNLFSLEWLLTGKGEMLNESVVQQTSYGNNSPNVNGNRNNVNGTADFSRFLDELSAQRSLVERTLALLEKRDSQVDRLLTLLENQK